MSEIVRELSQLGWDDNKIGKELGMDSLAITDHAYLQSLHADGGAEYEAAVAERRKQYLDRLRKAPQ